MRIFVIGPGRSGTSWVTSTLGSTPGAGFLLEPDNPGQYPFALRAAEGVGTWPILEADDRGPPSLRRLWDVAFGAPVRYLPGQQRVAAWLHSKSNHEERSRMMDAEDPKASIRLRLAAALAVPRNLPPGTQHRIVKSIRSHFTVEWVCENWKPTVVVCRRHPLDIVASRMEMQYRSRPGLVAQATRDQSKLRYGVEIPQTVGYAASYAWGVGLQMSALDDVLDEHPGFHAIDHEDLCRDPVGQFRSLATALGLEWTVENEAAVEASNRPGTGYELNRIAAYLPGSWRRRLSADDARAVADVIAHFPIAARYDLEVTRSS